MKKVFVVVMDYEEKSEGMFTETGIEVSLDNQLFFMRENGNIQSYKETEAYEVKESEQEAVIAMAEKHRKDE